MAANKITWEQFAVCNNDARGIRYRFEDLCRQLFVYEFLSQNKEQKHIHSNPNNAGLESEPIYDEEKKRWIGYQAKFFDSNVDYAQIQHSADETVKYYTGKVDYVYIFCNKPITTTCKSYNKIVSTLSNANISTELITDITILDMVRKYPNLGLYYFEHHSLSYEWFKNHTNDILAKLGDRYNHDFNIETKTAERLSLFIHDTDAIKYINQKKKELLKNIDDLDWRYDEFHEYKSILRNTVANIADITAENILDSVEWNEIISNAVCRKIRAYDIEVEKLKKEREKLWNLVQHEKNEESKRQLREKILHINDKVEIYETIIKISNILKLTQEEVSLMRSQILVLEGSAGTGKSHLLANETEKILSCNQWALMLVGGDYLGNNPIIEQICSEMALNYSFFDVLYILNTEGEKTNCIVPVLIDAINESWNKALWKSALPVLFNKIRTLENIKLVVSFRTEYQKVLIDNVELQKNGVYVIAHQGFSEESFESTKRFLNHYGIVFTPLHMFNYAITNPLFLTLYCKTYQGDEIELPVLYERLLSVANTNIHKNMSQALMGAGYDVNDDVVTPVVLALADFINETGKRYFSRDEISNLPIWKTNGISLRPLIQNMIRENILHDFMYDDGERLYFSYDQMNDYFCAKTILSHLSSKDELRKYIEDNILGINDTESINYQNRDLFIYVCALFAEKYGEECINIIDNIKDEYERAYMFDMYVDSFQWRKHSSMSAESFLEMCNKYNAQTEKVWNMFISNSVKQNSLFNADTLHNILLGYPLNKRDYVWTIYINNMEHEQENRLVQMIQMYCEGNGLELADKRQTELLLTLFGWLLTSSSRWLRDYASKAMIELLKLNFDMVEVILRKFTEVNDPYVIQRLYGVAWGACIKRISRDNNVYLSLAKYVYERIFCAKEVYPDILLRDYARLIIERYMYEYSEDKIFDDRTISPPYRSESIPEIEDQGYLKGKYEKGLFRLIYSMRFEGSGWYGDFGRYVFESALSDFEVKHDQIFNYAVFYIVNQLGYNNDLFGDYDSNIGMYNYNRHTTAKLERIGKKYQWIAMYNILARITDHYEMRDRFSQTDEIQKYEGPWEPYVRDFDASLSELFMRDNNMPVFEDIIDDKEIFSEEIERKLNLDQESVWIKEYPIFFDCQKRELLIKDTIGAGWVVLSKYAGSKILNKDKLQIWNWIYGYFVTDSQYDKLKYYANKKLDLLNSDITCIPETYAVYCREYPWAKGCADFKSLAYKSISIRTGEKKVVEEICSVPDFSNLDDWLNMNISEEEIEIDEKGNIEETDLVHFPKIVMKEEIISREIDVEEDIGEIICASVNFLWEEEYDASKNEAISWYAPCAEIIEEMKLQYGKCDGAFYDENGAIAAFDTSVTNQQAGIVIRKDLLDAFLKRKDYRLVWFVKAGKEIHVTDHSIGKYSDWTGLYSYEEDKISGKLYMCNDFED